MENTGAKLAEDMGDYVNTFSDKSKDFIEGFCRQHRTLQQSSFKMILKLIEHMATDEYRTDPRNEDSKDIAKKLLSGFKKELNDDDFKPSNFLRFI